MKKTSIFTVSNLWQERQGHHVLKNVNFEVEEGEFLGIIGPNGGGKTTLLRLLLGLDSPSKGTIEFYGEPIERSSNRKFIGYVPQHIASRDLSFPATVWEVVLSGRTVGKGVFRWFDRTDQAIARRSLQAMGIWPLRHRRLGALSGGERQRTFVARALAGQSKVLVLDEPTAAIDEENQEVFYHSLRQMRDEFDLTIIIVSHDLEVISREADRVLCLNRSIVTHGDKLDHQHLSHSHL